jgi:hypothetical protein
MSVPMRKRSSFVYIFSTVNVKCGHVDPPRYFYVMFSYSEINIVVFSRLNKNHILTVILDFRLFSSARYGYKHC